jgi:hypothetical protein
LLIDRQVEEKGKELSELSGGPAGACLYLVDGDVGAADSLGQGFLGEVEGFSTLFEPLAKR